MGLFDLFSKKEYIEILGVRFPLFMGSRIWVDSKNTNRYSRKDYYYRMEIEKINSYSMKLYEYGFNKIDNIKYVNSNSYVIIEVKNNQLHIAFHVNK